MGHSPLYPYFETIHSDTSGTTAGKRNLAAVQVRGNYCWLGVKIMRATFRGAHKPVINDNKKKHSPRPSFRMQYNYDVDSIWVCTSKCFFPKNMGVKIPRLTTQVNFWGGGHLTPRPPQFLHPWCNLKPPKQCIECKLAGSHSTSVVEGTTWLSRRWSQTADGHETGTTVTSSRRRRRELSHAGHRTFHVILRRLLQWQSTTHSLTKPSSTSTITHIH